MPNLTDEIRKEQGSQADPAGEPNGAPLPPARAVPQRSRRFRVSSLWLRRCDGTLVEDESPSRRILPYVISRRIDSLAYHESHYDVSKTLPWLREYNKSVEGHKATL